MRLVSLLFVLPLLAAETTGPVFHAGGPDAAKYGQPEGYPKTSSHDDGDSQKYIVGSSTHFDETFPTHTVVHGRAAWNFRRAEKAPSIHYDFEQHNYTLNDYLDHVPATGLLIACDDMILSETYQYARTDHDRFTAYSMTKTLISMLMGIAISEGKIKSIDDPASAYVPALAKSAYGGIPLRS